MTPRSHVEWYGLFSMRRPWRERRLLGPDLISMHEQFFEPNSALFVVPYLFASQLS